MQQARKRVGIFLGRLQPQHPGHENLIEAIFRENDEVVLCVGSAQTIPARDPESARNPLPLAARLATLRRFLEKTNFPQPWRIATAEDIQPEAAWPLHLKRCCQLDDRDRNTLYFSDPVSAEYEAGLRAAGFEFRFTERIKFTYRQREISSASEIRALGMPPLSHKK